MTTLTRSSALGLAAALGVLAVPSGTALSLFEPTQLTDSLSAGLGLEPLPDDLPEPQLPDFQTIYSSGMLLYVNPHAIDGGGRVVYAGLPVVGQVSLDRMTGGTDGVKVTAGPHMQATYAESNDTENHTWNSFSMAVGNNLWMIVAVDPADRDHFAVVGWYAYPTGGSVGEDDLDPWGAVCAAVRCLRL